MNQIFISLFTSRTKSEREFFSLSLLELSISTLAGHWLVTFDLYTVAFVTSASALFPVLFQDVRKNILVRKSKVSAG